MRNLIFRVVTLGFLATAAWAEDKPLYENNFEQADLDKAPVDMLVLDGGFAVKQEAGNRFLELPGAPLDSYGVLFGPTDKDGVVVSARIYGTGKGRRFPAFGVGLNGAGGYRLQLSPAKKLVELYKTDVLKLSAPYEWESGKWTRLRLQVRKVNDGAWRIEGKAWAEGSQEPAAWSLVFEESEEPRPGRAGLFGNPFSGTPIRYDDLLVQRVSAGH